MSKVPLTLDVDRYICTELEDMRNMVKHLDFSSLPASIERVQRHATAMEDGLFSQKDFIEDLRRILKNKNEEPESEVIRKLNLSFKKYDEAKGK